MRRLILTLAVGLVVASAAVAQFALWSIRPVYDSIEMKLDNTLIATDSAGVTSLWGIDGRRLFTTPDKVMPYCENYGALVGKDNSLKGFVDTKGRFVEPEAQNLTVAYSDPYFHDGYMICHAGSRTTYLTPEGKEATFIPSVRSYPFRRGYAPYMTYLSLEKMNDPCYGYYTSTGEAVTFTLNNKRVEPKDVHFLSGIAAGGKGIAVIKDKLYWYDTSTKSLSPLLAGDVSLPEKKRHLELEGKYDEYFQFLPIDRDIEILAKNSKKDLALLKFGADLTPKAIVFEDSTMTFAEPAPEAVTYTSALTSIGTAKKGLQFNGRDFLPEQFDEIGLSYGNRAMVSLAGKWGLLLADTVLNVKVTLNKGDDVAFRHQKFETQLRVDLPPEISTRELRLDLPSARGLDLDRTSRVSKDTEYGNFVQYDCVLNIPANLPDSIITIDYSPLKITYDGIKLADRPFTVNAWYLKYYNVDPIDSETTVKDGVATITINIDAQRRAGDHDYPFDVKIQADSLPISYEKLSETRYKCIISNLKDGTNLMNVVVTEKGCPSSYFPFEISYVRPIKKRDVESVSVRKISDLDLPRLGIDSLVPIGIEPSAVPELETPNLEAPAAEPPAAPETPEAGEGPAAEPSAASETPAAATTPASEVPAASETPKAGEAPVQQPVSPLTKMVLHLDN